MREVFFYLHFENTFFLRFLCEKNFLEGIIIISIVFVSVQLLYFCVESGWDAIGNLHFVVRVWFLTKIS